MSGVPGGAPNEEFTLIDLVLAVRRRWLLVLVSLIAGVGVALTLAVTHQPRFRSEASLEVCQVTLFTGVGIQTTWIEAPTIMAKRLMEAFVNGGAQDNGGLPLIENVRHQSDLDKQILVISALGHTSQEAQGFLQQVVSGLLADHRRKFDAQLQPEGAYLAYLRRQIEVLQDFLDAKPELANVRAHRPEAAQTMLELAKLRGAVIALRKWEYSIEVSSLDPLSFPTRVLVEPSLPPGPQGRGLPAFLAMGVVLGLGFGILAAMFAEFIGSARHAYSRRRGVLKNA